MKTYMKIVGTVGIILSSLILFKYVNKKVGIIFFILGVILMVYFILKNSNKGNVTNILQLEELIDYYEENKKYTKNNDVKKIDLPIYYINLDRSTKRDIFMKKQFNMFNIEDITRISAIDGNRLNEFLFVNDYIDMSESEIGCTLSHIKAIKTAYEDNKEYAIIMEDDAVLYLIPYWVITLKQIISLAPSGWEIIKLFSIKNKSSDTFFVKHNSLEPSYSTMAYIINRKGMKRLLDRVYYDGRVIIKRSDGILNGTSDQYIYGLLNTYDITYPLFMCGDEMLESTIHRDHETSHINRSKYILRFYTKFYLIDKIDIKQLKFSKTLYDMKEFLDSINVSYYLGCGTLLGVYRDNKFISHDGDIDLHVHIDDYSPLIEKESENFILKKSFGETERGYEITFEHKITKICLDIFFVYDEDDYSWFASYNGICDKAKYKMCRYKIPKCDIIGISFLNCYFPIPVETEKYLMSIYGPNWNIPIKYSYYEGLELYNYGVIQDDFKEEDRKIIPKQSQKYSLWPRKIMEMKRPIIWLYWQNKSEYHTKPPYLDLCLDTVKKYCGKTFEIIVLDDKMIPVISRVINKNFMNIEPLAMRADYIRFCLLYEYGGIWLDSDIVVMKDLSYIIDDLNRFNFVTFEHEEENDISIGMIGGNKNNLYCKYMKILFEEDNEFSKWKHKKYTIKWAGPTEKSKDFLNKIRVFFPVEIKMYPSDMIYPINWKKSKEYYWGIGNIDKKILNLPAVYLHNQMYDKKHKEISKEDVLNSNFRISDLFRTIL